MTYLFNKNVNPQNNNVAVSTTNPLPVTLGSENITINGNVSIGATVNVASSPENPVHVHLTEVGTSGNLTTSYLPIGGNVNVSNWQAYTNANITSSITLTTNIQNNNSVVSTTNPLPVTSITSFNSIGNLDTTRDGFGKARVVEPFTLFDSNFIYSDDSRNWNSNTAVGGTSLFVNNQSHVAMTANGTVGSKCIRETKKVFKYQPGKSLLTMSSFQMAPINTYNANTGLRQRVGYFDANNGTYFEANGNTLHMVIRSSVTGNVVENRVPQTLWNVDKLNGTGASNLTINVANSQIFWTDTEWLGVGSVRTGFVIDGQFIICNIFNHANRDTGVYMQSATLPVHLEIENLTTTGVPATLKHICNSVISEGGYTPSAASRAVATPLNGVNLNQTTFTPVIALRLKSSFKNAVVIPSLLTAWGLQNTPFVYKVSMNENVANGSWVSAGTESAVEYNISATDISGGDMLMQGLYGGGTIGSHLEMNLKDFDHSLQLRRRLDGTMETFVISVLATSNNDDTVATLTWQEFY